LTNPSKNHSVDIRQQPNAPDLGTGATYLTEDGPIASPAPNTKGEAEETSSSQPHSRSALLLLDALGALAWKGDTHAAAGIYARMKRIDPTFSFEQEGFRSFRQLLEAAERAQLVGVVRAPGASDLTVRATVPTSTSPSIARSPATNMRINPELWRALLDWEPSARYLFNRAQGRPIKSANLAEDENNVLVPSISREEQLEWMHEFASAQENEDVKQVLLSALDEDVPVRGFSRAVRSLEVAGRRWKRYLKKRVLDRATTWATAQSIPISVIESVEAPMKAEDPTSHSAYPAEAVTDEAAMKSRVLNILSAMPLSELLRLPIPVEFALKQ